MNEHGARWLDEIRSLGLFGRAWIAGIFVFSAARALIAWPALSQYGVDPVLFLALDLITAFPYGIGQAVTVKLLRTEGRPVRDAVPWGVMVGVMFMAPYVYIVLASGSMPLLAYLGVLLWMLVFGILAVMRMRRQVLEGRRGTDNGAPDPTATGPQQPESQRAESQGPLRGGS